MGERGADVAVADVVPAAAMRSRAPCACRVCSVSARNSLLTKA